MHEKEPKAHQVTPLYLKRVTCQTKKSDFYKNKKTKQKRKMQSIVNIQIHTYQTSDNTGNCSLCNCEDNKLFEKSHQCSVTGIQKRDDRLKLST